MTINSVLSVAVGNPEDALTVARRARSLGFNSTVGIAHDGAGQSQALPERQLRIYQEIRRLETSVFSFAHYDRFQENLVRGLPNAWHCHAGARFLYVCEDGLVHWCSQQRGHPGIPLTDYTHEDIERQYAIVKECAPFCGISCVQQNGCWTKSGQNPRGMLQQLIERRRATDPNFGLSFWCRPPVFAPAVRNRAAPWRRQRPGGTWPARRDADAPTKPPGEICDATLRPDLGGKKDLPFRRTRVMDVGYRRGYSKPHEISKPRNATKLFLLTAKDAIIAFSTEPDARRAMADGDGLFASPDDLTQITADWPSARLVQLWNRIPGVAPIKKFTDRPTALKRIWAAIQVLEPVRPPHD